MEWGPTSTKVAMDWDLPLASFAPFTSAPSFSGGGVTLATIMAQLEDLCIFSFLYLLDTLFLYHWSCDHLVIANLVFIRYTHTHIYIYIWWGYYYILSPISPCVVSFLSLCIWFLFSIFNLLFLFHTKMLWWVLFKVFQKYRLPKSFLPWTLFLQSFSRDRKSVV